MNYPNNRSNTGILGRRDSNPRIFLVGYWLFDDLFLMLAKCWPNIFRALLPFCSLEGIQRAYVRAVINTLECPICWDTHAIFSPADNIIDANVRLVWYGFLYLTFARFRNGIQNDFLICWSPVQGFPVSGLKNILPPRNKVCCFWLIKACSTGGSISISRVPVLAFVVSSTAMLK